MAYFPDLSPYAYGHADHPNVVHVGWLDGLHDYPRGTVPPHLIEKLKRLAKHPVELYRGLHDCELCPKDRSPDLHPEMRSNGEIRITVRTFPEADEVEASATLLPTRATESGAILYRQITYAAPVLIVHYIEAHGYLPPTEFMKALEAVPE
jgi:hypothetical protein